MEKKFKTAVLTGILFAGFLFSQGALANPIEVQSYNDWVKAVNYINRVTTGETLVVNIQAKITFPEESVAPIITSKNPSPSILGLVTPFQCCRTRPRRV